MDKNLFDKSGLVVRKGDVLKINPDDDVWHDVVVEIKGKLALSCGDDVMPIEMALSEENPALIVGHIDTHCAKCGGVLAQEQQERILNDKAKEAWRTT